MSSGARARVLILGCGDLGMAIARRVLAAGSAVRGLRRRPPADAPAWLQHGDASDPAAVTALSAFAPTAVILAANPGLRAAARGDHPGNRLAEAAALARQTFPTARLVLTGSTAVYGDHGGAEVDETTPLSSEPRAKALADIETTVLRHSNAIVLRLAAIVGPGRDHVRDRIAAAAAAGQPVPIRQPAAATFNAIHESDAADLCALAVGLTIRRPLPPTPCASPDLSRATGVVNTCAPYGLTWGGYHQALADDLGVALPALVPDPAASTALGRRVRADRLRGLLPADWSWRTVSAAD